jgi:prevent-host-death family protein
MAFPNSDPSSDKAMLAFSTTDLARKTGDIVTAALQGPITLTQHNKPRLVMLSVEAFELLKAGVPPTSRRAGLLRDMPQDLAEEFRAAAQTYIDSDNF